MLNVSDRNYKIDILRGFAILSVLFLHFSLTYHLADSALNKLFNLNFLKTVLSNGNYGVTIFFVISGFLITTTSLNRFKELASIKLSSFYLYRFSRIMPCLVLALSLIVIFSQAHIPIFENDPNTTTLAVSIFSVLTFWHNVLMHQIGYFNYCLNVYWSLSVEEVFYLSFPIICLLLRRPFYIAGFLIMLILIGPAYRSLYASDEIVALYGYFSCFDAIALGCFTALIGNKIKPPRLLTIVLQLCGWTGIVAMFVYSNIMDNVVAGVSIVAISTAALLIAANQQTNYRAREPGILSSTVAWFGKNSYELYLFHIIVLAMMKQFVKPELLNDYTKLVWFAVFIGLSAAISGVIAKCYSEPMNKSLRDAAKSNLVPAA